MKQKSQFVIKEGDERTGTENSGMNFIRNNYVVYQGNISKVLFEDGKRKWDAIGDWYVSFDSLYQWYLDS